REDGLWSLSPPHSLAIAFAVDEKLKRFRLRHSTDRECPALSSRRAAEEIRVAEDRGGDAAPLHLHVLDIDEVRGRDALVERVAPEDIDQPLIGHDPDVVLVAVPVEQRAETPVTDP